VNGLHRPTTYADLIVTALERYSERVAFIHEDRRWTYNEVRSQVSRFCTALDRLGMRPGMGVACLSGNRPEAWMFSAAAMLIGCRFTPLHPLGGLDDQAFIAEDAELSLLAYDPAQFQERADDLRLRASGLRLASFGPAEGTDDLLALAAVERPAALPSVPAEDDIAWLLYTGGTTGRPKGVMVAHRSFVQNFFLTLTEFQWPAQITFLACTPITHAAGTFVVPTLVRGGTFITMPAFDPAHFRELVAEHGATATFMVPSIIYRLLDLPQAGDGQLRSLETIIYGASPMSPPRMLEALDRFGPIFNQLYAQSEAPNTVCVLRKEDHDPGRPHLLASCGQPMVGIQVQLQDEGGAEVPTGEVGEICVRGRLVMNGYWKRPEQTAEALRGGWLHTTDLARRDDDNYFYIVDRRKDMIISGGFNVYPREVEDVLAAHPAVAVAAVIGVPDETWGEAVRAIVVLRPGASADADELMALVRRSKGPVHTPKSIEFVDAIPLTAVGKPDKKALRATFWSGRDRSVN